MKFSCSRDELQNALTICQRGISTRSTMPVLEGILFSVYDGTLHLTATDLEIGVQTSIPADVDQDGSIVLSASLILDMIRRLSGDTVFFSSDAKNRMQIKNLLSDFSLNGMPASDYPEFPAIEQGHSVALPADTLKKLIHGTGFSIAVSESIPVLTGVKMEVSHDGIRFVALDGYRLALENGTLSAPAEEPSEVIIPGRSMTELSKLLSSDSDVQVAFSSSQIFFTIGDTVFTSRLLDGDFINYKGIIPSDSTIRLTVDRQALLSGCERAALLARAGKNNLIKMEIEPDQVTLVSNADIGSIHEVVALENDGEALKIAFNAKFFIDALKVIDDEKIHIDLTTAVGPAVIRPIEGEAYTYLILPVRIAE